MKSKINNNGMMPSGGVSSGATASGMNSLAGGLVGTNAANQ
jgi:hypothetical protein